MSYNPKEYWTQRGINWPFEPIENLSLHRQVKADICAILEEAKPKALLDIGCGSGYFFEEFAKFPEMKVLGIDFSPTMIEHARLQILRTKASNVSLSQRDVKEINTETFPRFDMVLSKNCLMHIEPKDIIRVANILKAIAEKWIVLIEYSGINEVLNPTNFGHPYMLLFEGLTLRRSKRYENNSLYWWEQPWLNTHL